MGWTGGKKNNFCNRQPKMHMKNKKRDLEGLNICMVTSAHSPKDDRIFYKEARSLVKAGAQVAYIYPGSQSPPKETYGIRFKPYKGGGGLRRRITTSGKLYEAIIDGKYDVIHCHEPDALIAALNAKKKVGGKVIFDSHEMWGAVAAGKFPRSLWRIVEILFQKLESKWLSKCDGGIGASWAISEYLKCFLPLGYVETILNVPVVDVFGEFSRPEWKEETILCHDGYLTFDRGLKVMAEAIRIIVNEGKCKVKFKIVGDVFGKEKQWLESFVHMNNLEEVIVRTGWLEYDRVGKAISECHIGLICLQKTPNNIVTSSNKIFNYMVYGLPFVAPSFRYSCRKLVDEEQCGILADSSSPESYAKAIIWMIENKEKTLEMGRRARLASQKKYQWKHMEPVLVDLYKKVVGF